MTTRVRFALALFLTALFAAGTPLAQSATINWTNTSGGSWDAATNWDPNQAPGAADTAVITTAGDYTVTVTASETVGSLILGGASGTQTLSLSSGSFNLGGTATVNAGGAIDLGGATLAGTGAWTVNGSFTWTSGVISSGGGMILGGVSILDPGNPDVMTLSAVLGNAGQLTLSGAANGLYFTSGTLTNLSSGTMTFLDGASPGYNGGNDTIINAGVLIISNNVGGPATSLGVSFTNFGDVQVLSGTFNIASGGMATGTFEVSSNAMLEFSSNFTLDGGSTTSVAGALLVNSGTVNLLGSLSGPGTNAIAGGVLSVSSPGTMVMSNLELAGGTLSGNAPVIVLGAFSWLSGTMSDTGGLTLNGSGSLLGPNIGSMTLSGPLNNAGQLTWTGSGGNLYLANGAITNLAGGALTITADVTAIYDGGNDVIANLGLLRKTGGTGSTAFNAQFINTGDAQILSGVLVLPSGGTNLGTIEVSNNATLQFPNNYTLNAGSSVAGNGAMWLSSGTLTVLGNLDLTSPSNLVSGGMLLVNSPGAVTMPDLSLTGGTIGGNGLITFSGNFSWTAGIVASTGGLLLTGTSSLNGPNTGSMTLNGLLVNTGQLTWSGSGGNLYLDNGTISNQPGGTITVAADVTAIYDGGNDAICNAGLLRKAGGAGSTAFNAQFINTGDAQILSGSLVLPAGGTNFGTIEVSSNALLQFPNNYTLNAGSSVTGNGAMWLSSGTLTVLGNLGLSSPSNLVSSGTLLVNSPGTVTMPNMSFTGGTISGNALITFPGNFTWTSGTMANTGGLELAGASSLNGPNTGSMSLSGTLINTGQLTWSGSGGNLYLSGGTISNQPGGTIALMTDVSAQYDGGNNAIYNAGVWRKTGGTNTSSLSAIFVNTGDVQVQSGTLNLPSGGSATGGFEISGNAGLQFADDYTLNSGSSVSGAGTVNFSSGTINAGGTYNLSGLSTFTGATVNFSGNYTIVGQPVTISSGAVNFNTGGTLNLGALTLTGGTLGGSNAVPVSGPFAWTNGTMANSGGLILDGSSIMAGPNTGSMTLNGLLVNAGQLTWTGSGGNLYLANGTISNQPGGTIAVTTDVSAYYDGGNNAIYNSGTWRKSGGTNTSSFSASFVNSGDVQVQSGTITLPSEGSATGSFEVSSNAQLQFTDDYSLNPGSSVSGAGTVNFSGGTINAAGTYHLSGLSTFTGATVSFSGNYTISGQPVTISSGAVNFNAGGVLNLSALTLTGGTLGGSNAVPVSGPFAWTNGTMANSGGLVLGGNSILAGPNTGAMTLNGPLINAGQLTWTGSGGNLYLANGTISNQPGGTVTITADVSAYFDGGNNAIYNSGTLRKTGGTGTTSINASVVNGGTIDAQKGTLQFPVSLTLMASNTLNFGLNGAGGVAGTDFGVISFNGGGALNLAGTLSANLNGGFVPPVGAVFNVLNYGSEAGGFTGLKLPSLAVWQTNAGSSSYSIKVLKWVPALSWAAPGAIIYGTALGDTELDATAASPTNLAGSLAGTFTYAPVAGTILDSGSNQTLSVSFTPSDLTDYTNVGTNVTIDVQKAPLTVAATNTAKTYGQTVAFNGTEFVATGLVNGDTVSNVTLSNAGGPPASAVAGSPYSIIPSAAVVTDLTNYTITYQNGALTVNPAPLTITANNASKYAGQTVAFTGNEYVAAGLQNSETIGSVNITSAGAAAGAMAGNYPIIPSAATGGTFAPGNYSITYVDGVLTVNPLPILQIGTASNVAILSWTTNSAGFVLQTSGNLADSNSWTPVQSPATVVDGQNTVSNAISGEGGFYRLKF